MENTIENRNKKLVEEFFDLVNKMSNDDDLVKEFNEAFKRQHRTLQQGAMGVFKQVIEEHAKKDDHWIDLRNEASVKWAKKVAATEYPGRFPLI